MFKHLSAFFLGGITLSHARVVINEIHYHPVEQRAFTADGLPVMDLSEDVHEFIELYNAGPDRVELTGWQLTDGIDWEFPEGAWLDPRSYMVVAKNPTAVIQAYTEIALLPIQGPWEGTLSNDSDTVTLSDRSGNVVDSVTYRSGFPWPNAADALGADQAWTGLDPSMHQYRGRSLERVSVSHDSNDPANWLASPAEGNPSPSKPNTLTRSTPIPVVNHVAVSDSDSGEVQVTEDHPARITCAFTDSSRVRSIFVESFVENIESEDEPLERLSMRKIVQGERVTFEATLPAKPQGSVVRYRIVAETMDGETVQAPRSDDAETWYGYATVSDSSPTAPRAYELFYSQASQAQLEENLKYGPIRDVGEDKVTDYGPSRSLGWNGAVPGIFTFQGNVWDVQLRWQGSPYFRGFPSGVRFKVKFPRYHRLGGLKSILITNKGTETREGHLLFQYAGIPVSETRPVSMQVNGGDAFAALELGEMNDDMLSAYWKREEALRGTARPGTLGRLVKASGLFNDAGPWGNANGAPLKDNGDHKALERYPWTFPLKNQKWRGYVGFHTMLEDHQRASSDDAMLREFLEQSWDVSKALDYYAISNWMDFWDDDAHNYFYWKPANGKWTVLPWDFDQVMGSQGGVFDGGDLGEKPADWPENEPWPPTVDSGPVLEEKPADWPAGEPWPPVLVDPGLGEKPADWPADEPWPPTGGGGGEVIGEKPADWPENEPWPPINDGGGEKPDDWPENEPWPPSDAPLAAGHVFEQSVIKSFQAEYDARLLHWANTLLHPSNLTALGMDPIHIKHAEAKLQEINGAESYVSPSRPVNLAPSEGGSASAATTLQSSAYTHESGTPHANTVWEIREEGSSYLHPVFKEESDAYLAGLLVPEDTLIVGKVYHWRCTYIDASGVESLISEETSFTFGLNHARPEGLYLSEIAAINEDLLHDGRTVDWVELHNGSDAPRSLDGLALGGGPDDEPYALPSINLPSGQFLIVRFGQANEQSTGYYSGFKLSGKGDTVTLLGIPDAAGHRSLVDGVTFGIQVPDKTLARFGDRWALAEPTPQAANVETALGSSSALRINEWMASRSKGADWVELYNTANKPVELSGMMLTNGSDNALPFPPHAYLGAKAYLKLLADGNAYKGADHLAFKLSKTGERLSLRDAESEVIDRVAFWSQKRDVSEGRLGDNEYATYPEGGTPGSPNSADSDGDLIPDRWEMAHGMDPNNSADANEDLDADGFGNLSEYLSDTAPNDSRDYLSLQITRAYQGGGGITIIFQAKPDRVYQLEYSDRLDGRWEVVRSEPAKSKASTVALDIGDPRKQGYFRILVSLP